ncbi:uncharacterized protein LOC134196631 [Corticium candelabrum]|uniref:uncharacterized protein LOC134196631 n=1 Tax=Corticium candelabrum TaxID=121492 RepID=UPI002E27191C|nr:uncharacterized protein LOC134196631 [Corticium candelabrum]
MAIDASEVDGRMWFTSTKFCPHVAEGLHPSAKRARVYTEQLPSVYQLKHLRAQRHDGRVPESLCGYTLEGRKLKLTTDVKHRIRVKRIQLHLRSLHETIKPTYKSMTPFRLSVSECSDHDHDYYALHLDLGLVYKVLHQTDSSVLYSLLYSFHTPLPLLVFPQSDTNAVDCPDDDVDSSDSEFNESDDDDEVDCSLILQQLVGNFAKDGITLVTCRGVSAPNSEPYKMSVDEYGEINCSGVESSYLPTQFEILADKQNVSIPGHVVCIRSRGFGPEEKFYVALTGSGRKMRFTIENAGSGMKNHSIPKDKKFYFTVSEHSGGYRFRAVTGDKRYLAFESAPRGGVQVTVTDKNAKSKLLSTVFDLIKW